MLVVQDLLGESPDAVLVPLDLELEGAGLAVARPAAVAGVPLAVRG